MDRNSIIGMMLLAMLFLVYVKINAPTEAELAEQQRLQDSLVMVDNAASQPLVDSINSQTTTQANAADSSIELDSVALLNKQKELGSLANHLIGEESETILENELIKITFSNKGAKITSAQLKKFDKVLINDEHEEETFPLLLLEDSKNRFNLATQRAGSKISTEDLYFDVEPWGKQIKFSANTSEGSPIEIIYSLSDTEYIVDLDISTPYNNQRFDLEWENYQDRIEDNTTYESMYSSIYYKPLDDDTDHCSCTGADKVEFDGDRLKWVSHSNQFFNSTLISNDGGFIDSELEVVPTEEEDENLKLAKSKLGFETDKSGAYSMLMYLGPNEFNRLKTMDMDLEYIVPFGSSIFGSINRYIIRPMFNFLTGLLGSKGLAIVLLTLLVKLALYPLTFKMLKSQSKMAALKPVLEKIKEKMGGDAQAQQVETMKTYREYGVNPLGGCMPMVLQMPIWFALYRFFPASITFRQADFLWAKDLSSFDVITYLPFNIPFYGDHVSLFTILWAISLVVYTYYNSKYMDYSAQPMMKYMQYLMPFMFLFYFNNFASGLSCYLFFSNLFNIAQTLITKNYIIDQEKLKTELQSNKENPKKKSSFQARMEKALKEQQKVADQRKKKK